MKNYEFTCKKGDWITRFMVSSLREEPYIYNPDVYDSSCRVNGDWTKIVSPGRKKFIQEREFECRRNEEYDCKTLYFPFESEKVEFSRFWMQPVKLDYEAKLNLCVNEAGVYPFLFCTCGGAKLYVNGILQKKVMWYQINQEHCSTVDLPLHIGENELYIQCNELAERNTQVYFKLRYMGNDILTCRLPVSISEKELEHVRTIINSAYLERFNYQKPDIPILFEIPPKNGMELTLDLEFSDGHTKLPRRSKTVVLTEDTLRIQVGDLISRTTGMVKLSVSSVVSGICISRSLQFEYYDEDNMNGRYRLEADERKYSALKFAADNGTPVFQRALAILETDGDREMAQTIIKEELQRVNSRFDCSDFRIPAFFYALKSDKVPQDIKQDLKSALLNYRYWFDEPGNDVMWFFSENHALCFHTCEFLAGEMYPEEMFTNSMQKGTWHRDKAKELLCSWFKSFLKNGFSEWNSAVYIPIDMIALLALYDHAMDSQIHQYAAEALDRTFEILAQNSFRGVVAASYGRIYFKNLIGRRSNEASALNYIACGEGWLNQNCFSVVLMALSGYRPGEKVLSLYRCKAEGCVSESIQGEEHVRLYSYRADQYILASAPDYHPGEPGNQEHVLQLMIDDCDTQIWINHPGEASFFGDGRPSYFAGNGTLPLVHQDKNVARLTFHLLEQEVSYTHAYCPFHMFDEWIQKDKLLLLRRGCTVVALYAGNGLFITDKGPLKNLEVTSPGKQNVWYIQVDSVKEESRLEELAVKYNFDKED